MPAKFRYKFFTFLEMHDAVKYFSHKEGIMKAQSWRYIVSAIIILLLVNCSTSNIAKRGEYIRENSISKGLPRIDILARFGKPIETIWVYELNWQFLLPNNLDRDCLRY